MSKLKMFGWAVLAFVGISTYNWADRTWEQHKLSQRQEQAKIAEATRVSNLTPEQRQLEAAAAEERRVAAAKKAASDAEIARKKALAAAEEEKAGERRNTLVFAAVSNIIKRARDPKSVMVHSASYTTGKKAEGACVEYGARNGFGGMNREFIVVTAVGDVVTYKFNDPATWNRTCVGEGYDMAYLAQKTVKAYHARM